MNDFVNGVMNGVLNAAVRGDADLVVAGSGSADRHQPDLFDPRARAVIRYADPAAWITAVAIARAAATIAGRLEPWRHDVGIAVVSDHGPGETMAQVHANADAGFSLPLRYAAAGPGSMAGVACIAFGFRGPSLNFTMPPCDGIPIALLMAQAWLARGITRAVVVASFTAMGTAVGLARAVVLGPKTLLGDGTALGPSVTAWLAQVGD